MAGIASQLPSSFLINSDPRLAYQVGSRIHSQDGSSLGPGVARTCAVPPYPVPVAGVATSIFLVEYRHSLTILFQPSTTLSFGTVLGGRAEF